MMVQGMRLKIREVVTLLAVKGCLLSGVRLNLTNFLQHKLQLRYALAWGLAYPMSGLLSLKWKEKESVLPNHYFF